MNRQDATQKIIDAKIAKGLTWEEISKVSESSETWVVTALLGQATMTRSEAEKVGKLLELDEEVVQALTVVPLRGEIMKMPPTDPILYRLYEMMLQYAPTIREMILEKVGEGVMSAINFNLGVETQDDPKGGDPRIVITLNGKFLPFRTW
ncbi:cyanase [Paenibacillus pini]|uniref:Cyanate hydratase n=1 Tax=Paenibacillus pini JCM 16418 TaxID=1236976 RepID=W7YGC0_9BACL|nr:cyanase [Paenibacillus pini]GAF09985.1 cyanate hydratase [Paenibacillus pini JCM 16418]